MNYLSGQVERAPTTGQLHLQAAVALKRTCRLAAAKKLFPGAHLECALQWEALKKYVNKEDTREAGPWTFGEDVSQGDRTDIYTIASMVRSGKRLREIAESNPVEFMRYHKGMAALRTATTKMVAGERKCALFWGSTGCGKTRFPYDRWAPEDIYNVFDIKTPWFDGYDGQNVVILDECGPNTISTDFLKKITDRYPFTVPVKGGSMPWTTNIIILTSNHPLEHWWEKATHNDIQALRRRIHIFNFDDEEDKARAKAFFAAAAPSEAVEVPSEGSEADNDLLAVLPTVLDISDTD